MVFAGGDDKQRICDLYVESAAKKHWTGESDEILEIVEKYDKWPYRVRQRTLSNYAACAILGKEMIWKNLMPELEYWNTEEIMSKIDKSLEKRNVND